LALGRADVGQQLGSSGSGCPSRWASGGIGSLSWATGSRHRRIADLDLARTKECRS
jgi:hypothetical protein